MRPKLVRIHLLSFGPWRGRLAEGGEGRELPSGATLADLLALLSSSHVFEPKLLRCAAVSVNQVYAQPTQVLLDGDEVAILPPVSGGREGGGAVADAEGDAGWVTLGHEPIATDLLLQKIKAGGDGAVCVFDGIVRNNTRGRKTLFLDYEAYEGMARSEMTALRREAKTRFGVREVAIAHRLGRLHVGETSVLIAVASAHRGAAFEACRWVIDTLKQRVPIWKREQFVDGAVWADGEPFPDDLAGTAEKTAP